MGVPKKLILPPTLEHHKGREGGHVRTSLGEAGGWPEALFSDGSWIELELSPGVSGDGVAIVVAGEGTGMGGIGGGTDFGSGTGLEVGTI
ncbi:hypothetical protein ElyMa_006652000 [Elysia marginata]|uniref:Uncharacterized protein n=1 Tax=Elysia marginata TaxID=1093978 RepID=A0AAV4IKI5_9GAST|nr:hypothetical protein ElyMa_006652000 [Elysia marginata]